MTLPSGTMTSTFRFSRGDLPRVLAAGATVSSLGARTDLLTIIGFAALYTVLIVIEMSLMIKAIRQGPEPDDEPESALISETLIPAAE